MSMAGAYVLCLCFLRAIVWTDYCRYIVYFVARDMRGQTVSGAAVAAGDDPFGPYLDIGRPLLTATDSVGGAIDPHYFKVSICHLPLIEMSLEQLPGSSNRSRLSALERRQAPGVPSLHHLHQRTASQWRVLHWTRRGDPQEQPGQPAGGEAGGRGSLDDVPRRLLLPLLLERLDHGDEVSHQGGCQQECLRSIPQVNRSNTALDICLQSVVFRSHTPVITTDWKTLHQVSRPISEYLGLDLGNIPKQSTCHVSCHNTQFYRNSSSVTPS